MLYCINLFEEPFKPARLVYKHKGNKGKEQLDEQVEGKKAKHGLPEIERKKASVKGEIREQQAELQQDVAQKQAEEREQEAELGEEVQADIEAQDGTAADYVKSFLKFEKTSEFDVLTKYLQTNLELEGPDSAFNYKRWESAPDMEEIARLFENKEFPTKKGKRKFLEGLCSEDQSSKEFLKSRNALGEISKIIGKYFEMRRETTSDTIANIEKSPIPEVLKNGFQCLSKNFNSGSSLDKAIIAGGVIGGIILIYKVLNMQLTEKRKVSDLALWGAGLWGLNYLSGKVSKDGKTLLNRLDLFTEMDELKDDNLMRKFMQDIGLRENQEAVRTCIKLHDVDVKTLYEAHKSASIGLEGKKAIHASDIGLREGEIDGEAAYEIIEGLIQKTALNEFKRKEKQEAVEKGGKYKPNRNKKEWIRRNASAFFEEKFISGELGNYPLTFTDAIIMEYRTRDLEKIERKDAQSRGTHRIAAAVAGAGTWVWDTGAEYIPKAAGAIGGVAKGAYGIARDNVFVPVGNYLGPKWDEYWPKAKEAFKEFTGWKTVEAMEQKATFDKVLPPKFGCNILEPEKGFGRATIMGMPVKFEITTNKDGKDVIIVGGDVELVIDKGIAGNEREALKLETAIQGRMDGLVKERAKTVGAIAGKKIEWNASDKKWEIKDVDLNGDPRFAFIPNAKTNLTAQFGPDENSITLFVNDKEIPASGVNLNEMYRDSLIQKAIWDDPRYGKLLDKLSVEVTNIEQDPALGTVVSGKIAGLGFKAKPGVGGNKLDFLGAGGALNPATGGVEFLRISEPNGGATFLNEKAKQILTNPAFNTAFMKAEAMMDNTGESFWSRMGGLFSDRALWIIPTNLPAAVNGKILQRQWKFVLDFKKFEALEMFKQDLQGKTVQDMETVYKERIEKVIRQMELLDREFHAVRDEGEKAKRFEQFLYGGESSTGLENANYANNDYKELLGEYRKVITDKRFDYEGLESFGDISGGSGAKSWGAGDKAFEIYQFLLNVWSYNTRDFTINDRRLAGNIAMNPTINIHPKTQEYIRQAVTYKVRAALEVCQANDSKIELEELKTQLKDLMPKDWGRSTAVENYAADVAAGRAKPDEVVELDLKGPINPDSKNLDRIKKQMGEIFDREFPLRYAPKFSGEVVERYKSILRNLSEGMILRAITENGSEEEMLSRFSGKLAEIRDKAESSTVPDEIWNLIKDLFKWLAGYETWEWGLEGENPYVQNKLIKPRNKTLMANSMRKLEKYYVKRLIAEHGDWHIINDYNSEMVDFLNEIEIPFYREFHLNKAILANDTPAVLAEQYSEYLKETLRYCIDSEKRSAQESADADETNKRAGDSAWAAIKLEMENVIK